MNLNEVNDLINEVFKCSLKKSKNPIEDMFYEKPKTGVYDEKAEGYKLFIKASIINKSARDCIKSIVQKRNLNYFQTTRKSKKYWVIYKPRKD